MSLDVPDNINAERVETGLVKQTIVGLVDAGLAMLMVCLLLIYQTPQPLYQLVAPLNSTLLVLLLLVTYRILMLVLFNGTIGMKLTGVMLLNGEEQSLSIPEKLLAAFFILYKGVAYFNR